MDRLRSTVAELPLWIHYQIATASVDARTLPLSRDRLFGCYVPNETSHLGRRSWRGQSPAPSQCGPLHLDGGGVGWVKACRSRLRGAFSWGVTLEAGQSCITGLDL